MSKRVNVRVLDILLPYQMHIKVKEFRLYYRFNHFGIIQYAGKFSRKEQHKPFRPFSVSSYCVSKAKIDILLKYRETFYREVSLGRLSIPLKWVQPDTLTDGWFPLYSIGIKDPFLIRVQIHIPTIPQVSNFDSPNHASFDVENQTWEQDFINLQPQLQCQIYDVEELKEETEPSSGDNYSLVYSSSDPIYSISYEEPISREI